MILTGNRFPLVLIMLWLSKLQQQVTGPWTS
jgi:hypothetical protein